MRSRLWLAVVSKAQPRRAAGCLPKIDTQHTYIHQAHTPGDVEPPVWPPNMYTRPAAAAEPRKQRAIGARPAAPAAAVRSSQAAALGR